MGSMPIARPNMTMARSRAMGALGGKRTVAALNDAVTAPTVDGTLCPVAHGVARSRLCRTCAYREQTGRHGKGKNKR